jgi:uncharacterized repeat protein (TIGR01451 family)
MKRTVIAHGLFLCAALAAAAALAAPPSVELTTTVQQVKVTTDAKGVQHSKVVPMDRALPGTELVYTITYHNVGKQPAEDVVVSDPIPEHTLYMPGSAEGADMDISFSIDGGKTWGKPEALKVKNADGTSSDAQPKDYTHIRWVLKGKVAPGASGTVSFHTVLQ